jgi:hypothetical protein
MKIHLLRTGGGSKCGMGGRSPVTPNPDYVSCGQCRYLLSMTDGTTERRRQHLMTLNERERELKIGYWFS